MVEPQPSKLMVRVRFPSPALKKGAPVFRGSFCFAAYPSPEDRLAKIELERRRINHKAVAHLRGHNFVIGLGNGIAVDDFNHGTHVVLGAEL